MKVLLWTLGLLVLAFLIHSECSGQEPIKLYDFSGGLNTKAGLFGIKPNQCLDAFNVDFQAKRGAIVKRDGYFHIGQYDSIPSITSLYAHNYRDGTKELFGITKRQKGTNTAAAPTASWGTLWRSGDGRFTLDTSIYDYIYTGADMHWVSWKNKVILANGRQRPLIWNGDQCRSLVIPAPGEPTIIPIDSSGNLDGYYRYALRIDGTYQKDPDTLYGISYLSPPIQFDNEMALVCMFPALQKDSIWPELSYGSTWDTSDYGDTNYFAWEILRTVANDDREPEDITLYKLFTTLGRKNKLDTFTWIDNCPDDSLGDANHPARATSDLITMGLVDSCETGDTVHYKIRSRRFGMPNFLYRVIDSIDGAGVAETKGKVNIDTLLTGDIVLYICYMMTFFDSANLIESDSGRMLAIRPLVEDDTMFYRLSLPPVPGQDGALHRIVYKALMYKHIIYADTVVDSVTLDLLAGRQIDIVIDWADIATNQNPSGRFWSQDVVRSIIFGHDRLRTAYQNRILKGKINIINDTTMITNFFPVAVITSPDSFAFTDSLVWDSVSLRNPYYKTQAPHNLNNITVFNDKLWGSWGNRVSSSFLDSVGAWGMWDYYAFNLDDGDEITAIVPDREFINVYKNRSQHVLIPTSDGLMTQKWLVKGRGCVAPFSVQFYDGNIIYLGENGVYIESPNPYKDKGSERNRLSEPIDNLINAYSVAELKEAVAFIHNRQYRLSFPDKDTTYVCFLDFLPEKVWAIWDYAFQQAVYYDTVSRSGLVPSSDMIFITGEDSAIYKADSTDYDDSTSFPLRYKSSPFGLGGRNKTFGSIGLYVSPAMVDSTLSFILYDAMDTKVDSVSYTPDAPFTIKGLESNTSTHFYLAVEKEDSSGYREVSGIEIYLKDGGTVTRK